MQDDETQMKKVVFIVGESGWGWRVAGRMYLWVMTGYEVGEEASR